MQRRSVLGERRACEYAVVLRMKVQPSRRTGSIPDDLVSRIKVDVGMVRRVREVALRDPADQKPPPQTQHEHRIGPAAAHQPGLEMAVARGTALLLL